MKNSEHSEEPDLDKIMEEAWDELSVNSQKNNDRLLTTNEYTTYLVFSIFMLNLYDKSW
tara:strand:- start:21 stop:197 length:177 start_codon:yes stop_codon:yes gene_type:complete